MTSLELIKTAIDKHPEILMSKSSGHRSLFDDNGQDLDDVIWTMIEDTKHVMLMKSLEVFKFSEKANRFYAVMNESIINLVKAQAAIIHRDLAKSEDNQDPNFRTQYNYNGEPELIDIRIFHKKIICECGDIRYIKPQDAFQVKKCKPCTKMARLELRKKNYASKKR